MHCFKNLAIDILVESNRANNSMSGALESGQKGKKNWKEREDYSANAWWTGVILYGAKQPDSAATNLWSRDELMRIAQVEK